MYFGLKRAAGARKIQYSVVSKGDFNVNRAEGARKKQYFEGFQGRFLLKSRRRRAKKSGIWRILKGFLAKMSQNSVQSASADTRNPPLLKRSILEKGGGFWRELTLIVHSRDDQTDINLPSHFYLKK